MKLSFFTVLVFPSHKEPVINFDLLYLKENFELLKTVKSTLKLSKNSLKYDQLVKIMAYPPYGLKFFNETQNNLECFAVYFFICM